jgi:hypothetical protein
LTTEGRRKCFATFPGFKENCQAPSICSCCDSSHSPSGHQAPMGSARTVDRMAVRLAYIWGSQAQAASAADRQTCCHTEAHGPVRVGRHTSTHMLHNATTRAPRYFAPLANRFHSFIQ